MGRPPPVTPSHESRGTTNGIMRCVVIVYNQSGQIAALPAANPRPIMSSGQFCGGGNGQLSPGLANGLAGWLAGWLGTRIPMVLIKPVKNYLNIVSWNGYQPSIFYSWTSLHRKLLLFTWRGKSMAPEPRISRCTTSPPITQRYYET